MLPETRRVLGLSFAGLALAGVYSGAVQPYESLLALDVLGFSEARYAAISFLGAAAAVALSLNIGFLSDRLADRRRLIALCALVGAAGYGAVALFAHPVAFAVAGVCLIPVASTVSSQIYALLRTDPSLPPRTREYANQVARAFLAGAWVVAPPLAALLVTSRDDLFLVYGIGAVACLTSAGLFGLAALRRAAPPVPAGRPATPGYRASLALVVRPSSLVRLGALSLIKGAQKLNAMVIGPIILALPGGHYGSVGTAAALAAGIEVPAMLLWGLLLSRVSKQAIIFAASLIYAVYLVLVALAPGVPWVLAASVVNAIGGAALLSITISYVQEIIDGQTGLSTALISVVNLGGNAVAALAFALAVPTIGFTGAAIAGAALVAVGGLTVRLARHP